MLKLYPVLILAAFLLFSCGIFNSDNEDSVYTCNGIEYKPPYQICEGGILKIQCGKDHYSPAMQFCSEQDNLVYDKCGGKDYNTEKQICENARLYEMCGVLKVDPAIEVCCSDTTKFTLATQFCYGHIIVYKCGGKEYKLGEHICEDGILKKHCGSIWPNDPKTYDPETQFCNKHIIFDKCGGAAYNPLYQKCENNIILLKCEDCISNIVNVETFVDERDGTTYKYVTIGTQVWMAENLNYNASGSACYDNEASNCTIYGSLYNWATANTACPTGWHLPATDELHVLINSVGGDNVAGGHLKATSGWDEGGNGLDKYGFAALPGGFGYSDGSFIDIGIYGSWWAASEYKNNYADTWHMFYPIENAYFGYLDKNNLYSVRCIQD
jgi:uncharacterized protein (TIGR02145 family)